MVNDPPQKKTNSPKAGVPRTHRKEGLHDTGYSWAPPRPLAEERVSVSGVENRAEAESDATDKQVIGDMQSERVAIPLVRKETKRAAPSRAQGNTPPEGQRQEASPVPLRDEPAHWEEKADVAPRTDRSPGEQDADRAPRPAAPRTTNQTGKTLLGTPGVEPPEATKKSTAKEKATLRGTPPQRTPVPAKKRTLLGNPTPREVPRAGTAPVQHGSPAAQAASARDWVNASPKRTLLGTPAPGNPERQSGPADASRVSSTPTSSPKIPTEQPGAGRNQLSSKPTSGPEPPTSQSGATWSDKPSSKPASSRRRQEIEEAAEGQLRESELPLPSEDFNRDVLQQLGDLDDAIKSSQRTPMLDVESPGSVPSQSVLPGPEESRPTNELPRVGRYEVLARLKSGGMGSVYMCRLSSKEGFRRLFAMKVLHAHLTEDVEAVEAFSREARILAGLHHPNIVGIVDVGSSSEPYIVLDYIEGGSLFELFRATHDRRDPRLVIPPVLDALAGLGAAHEATDDEGAPLELVHCDISPHNVLVGIDGSARITDFGIAQLGAFDKQEKTARGKPRYLAPERLNREASDHRADIFSMGAVLYAGLSGSEPFAGDTPDESAWNVVHKNVPPPSTVGFRPPACFDEVCLKALSKRPEDRFQSAEEMADELRRIVEQHGLLARSVDVGKWVKMTLAPSLAARRAAAQRGTGGHAARKRQEAEPPPSEESPATTERQPDTQSLRGKAHAPPASDSAAENTSPIPTWDEGSYQDHTEILEAGENEKSSKYTSIVVYVALGLAVLVLLWVVIFPESVREFFHLNVDQPARIEAGTGDASPPETAPTETPASGSEDTPSPETSPSRSKGEQ